MLLAMQDLKASLLSLFHYPAGQNIPTGNLPSHLNTESHCTACSLSESYFLNAALFSLDAHLASMPLLVLLEFYLPQTAYYSHFEFKL